MARKSRKHIAALEEPAYEFLMYDTAQYIRLSVEDNKKRGNSIETQKSIMDNFLALNPDLKLYDVYIDNGTTGRNFERPEFKRMMNDVDNGKVKCVMVKDLSRLGRNAIDTGYYIEKYFPLNQVRFISITDNFDTNSNDSGGILLPLKNMINEAYALDISRKIKTQAAQSMKAGDFIGGRPPYGYLKHPDYCHKLIINEETAPVIKQIFEWAYSKVGLNEITKRLNEAYILPPSHYARSKGIITHDNLTGNGYWQTRTVAKIIADEVYTGDMVQGKTKSVERKQIPVDEKDWIRVKNTHNPIISREMFEAVKAYREQIAAESANRVINPYTENIFKGKIFCKCCGRSLHRQRNDNTYYFHCISNDRIAKETCKGIMLREDELCSIVLTILLKKAEIITGKQLRLQKDSATLNAKQTAKISKITELKRDIETSRRFLRSLYENLIKGVITNDEYFIMKADYESKISFSLDGMINLENEQKELESQVAQYRELANRVDSLDKNSELTAALIGCLIDRIEVSPDKEIDIDFRFDNEFDKIDEVVGKCVNL